MGYNWWRIHVGRDGVLPGSGVVWSLSIEEQFYLGIALTWLLLSRMRKATQFLGISLVVVVIFSTSVRFLLAQAHLQHGIFSNIPRIYYGTDTRMSGIAMGGILAWLLHLSDRRRKFTAILTVVQSRNAQFLAVAVLVLSLSVRAPLFRDAIRFSLQELAAMVLIAGALTTTSWPQPIRRIAHGHLFQAVGVASYSIYLTHYGAMYLFQSLMGQSLTRMIELTVELAFAIGLGLLCHQIFDKPFERWRNRFRPTVTHVQS